MSLATALEVLVKQLTSWWGLTTEEAFQFIKNMVEDEHGNRP